MPSRESAIPTLIDHLRNQGADTGDTQLKATVALLPAGGREHHTGQRVQVFHPVAITLAFQQTGAGAPMAVARFTGECVAKRSDSQPSLDVQAFDRQVELDGALRGEPASTLGAAAGRLMRELVAKHREITGRANNAHEHIEIDATSIARITAQRFELELGLERLAAYLALEDEWLSLLIAGDGGKDRRAEIAFEKLMLRDDFVKQPCSRALYRELVLEFKDYCTSMGFMDYYLWFRQSEALFDDAGDLKPETRAPMEQAVESWLSSDSAADARENALYWANRNFSIHPRHRTRVEALVDEVIERSRQRAPSPAQCRT